MYERNNYNVYDLLVVVIHKGWIECQNFSIFSNTTFTMAIQSINVV